MVPASPSIRRLFHRCARQRLYDVCLYNGPGCHPLEGETPTVAECHRSHRHQVLAEGLLLAPRPRVTDPCRHPGAPQVTPVLEDPTQPCWMQQSPGPRRRSAWQLGPPRLIPPPHPLQQSSDRRGSAHAAQQEWNSRQQFPRSTRVHRSFHSEPGPKQAAGGRNRERLLRAHAAQRIPTAASGAPPLVRRRRLSGAHSGQTLCELAPGLQPHLNPARASRPPLGPRGRLHSDSPALIWFQHPRGMNWPPNTPAPLEQRSRRFRAHEPRAPAA
mmetsp:Transcript_33923/g.88357  ORF Transcript_33923/g.88357 Transcript_33923/m.88357 type:complete len:272 (-) Transcript_33923:234-1049(-)